MASVATAGAGACVSGQAIEQMAELPDSLETHATEDTRTRGGRCCAPSWNQRAVNLAADAPGEGIALEDRANVLGAKATHYHNRLHM